MRLAMLHKRQEDWDTAILYWEQAAHHHWLEAYVELAKVYEHHLRDLSAALRWAAAANDLVDVAALTAYEKEAYRLELEHRLERLQRKMR
jgi:hypothetical protein